MRQRRFGEAVGAILMVGTAFMLGSCGYLAEHTAPRKVPAASRSAAALAADALFWQTLHAGDYAGIAAALDAETGAYLAHPDDPVTAAHVGWLHIWKLSERRRLESLRPVITDEASLARQYFSQAVALDPHDARYLGFLASATLAEGKIHADEAETRRGWFMLQAAKDAWPEFNLFTAGYVLSSQPARSERFRQALGWQWDDLDACFGARVDRRGADYGEFLGRATDHGPKRVCWNSSIAPHNFEGFFLNLGDMLVKSGDWQAGRRVYANARLSATYGEWSFRDVLESRIQEAPANVAAFNAVDGKPIMFEAEFSCVACHQR